ncbi:hypothetical protein D3I08_05130 [Enterococcus faecium]|nr:hypothetical protein [Enterococcus faecium]EGP5443032.1 hypothetical protein [Enterococcus faecium]TAQ15098.1 hypothetical protein EWU52_12815 [Enterococcus faecium]
MGTYGQSRCIESKISKISYIQLERSPNGGCSSFFYGSAPLEKDSEYLSIFRSCHDEKGGIR